jgi:hypothetical protein
MDDAADAVVNVPNAVKHALTAMTAPNALKNLKCATVSAMKAAQAATHVVSDLSVNAKSPAWMTVAIKTHLRNPQNWRTTPMATDRHAKGANATTADADAHAVASVLHKCRLAKQTHQQMKRFTPLKQTSMQHNASKMVNPCRHKASAAMNAASAVVASVPGVSAKPERVCQTTAWHRMYLTQIMHQSHKNMRIRQRQCTRQWPPHPRPCPRSARLLYP